MDDFNKRLNAWTEDTGCTANFGWVYDHQGHKLLQIGEISLSVYRKDAPDGDSLAAMLAKLEPQKAEAAETPPPTPSPAV